MEKFYKKDINGILWNCSLLKEKIDLITKNIFQSFLSGNKENQKKISSRDRNILQLELKILTDKAVLTYLERNLLQYPL